MISVNAIIGGGSATFLPSYTGTLVSYETVFNGMSLATGGTYQLNTLETGFGAFIPVFAAVYLTMTVASGFNPDAGIYSFGSYTANSYYLSLTTLPAITTKDFSMGLYPTISRAAVAGAVLGMRVDAAPVDFSEISLIVKITGMYI